MKSIFIYDKTRKIKLVQLREFVLFWIKELNYIQEEQIRLLDLMKLYKKKFSSTNLPEIKAMNIELLKQNNTTNLFLLEIYTYDKQITTFIEKKNWEKYLDFSKSYTDLVNRFTKIIQNHRHLKENIYLDSKEIIQKNITNHFVFSPHKTKKVCPN